jgi:hypothetical protein
VSVGVDLPTCPYTLRASPRRRHDRRRTGPVKVGAFVTRRLPLGTLSYSAALPVHSALWVSRGAGDRGYCIRGRSSRRCSSPHGNDADGRAVRR